MRTCKLCGRNIDLRHGNAVYCGDVCAGKAMRARESGECIEDGCLKPIRAKRRCASHYTMWHREQTGYVRLNYGVFRTESQRISDYNKNHRRRLITSAEESDRINIFEVATRDRWICGICNEPIDSSLNYPNPMSKSLDHIISIANGGSHSVDNVRIAHLICNNKRGATY